MHDIDFHNPRDPGALKAKADQNYYFELLHFTKDPLSFKFRTKEFLFSLQSIHCTDTTYNLTTGGVRG